MKNSVFWDIMLHYTIREAIEIELHLNSMNSENGFCLSKSWKTFHLLPERL
jgi:hypothetical protein